jgi:hypothetical protein
MNMIRILVSVCVLFLGLAARLDADEHCEALKPDLEKYLATGRLPLLEDPGEANTAKKFRHASGDGVLVKWNFGAAGRVECAFLAYRNSGGQYKYFRLSSYQADVEDIDRDGIGEIILFEDMPWGMDCSGVMMNLPHKLHIAHFDAPSGGLEIVTRNYGGYVFDHLKDLRAAYENQWRGDTEECEDAWVSLLKETHETAWFRLLMAASALSVVIFAMGLSRSKYWRWAARGVGALVLIVSLGIAFYSLGKVGWHYIGFCEAWSALEIVTGYKVHSVFVDVVSFALSVGGGLRLLIGS